MQTRTKTDPSSGHVYVVTYGFHSIAGQKPYLSVTGEHWAGTPMRKSEKNLISMGCNHDMIGVQFPELAALLPFHLCDADGVPMHYVENTVYQASNRDHWGLYKGERRQIRDGKTGELCWHLRIDDGTEYGADVPVHKTQQSGERPPEAITLRWFPWCTVGEGKERNFDAARHSAIWPDATDAELSVPATELRAALVARLPQVRAAMIAACEACGVPIPATV